MNETFSENELRLFAHFGKADLSEMEYFQKHPSFIYNIVLEEAFVDLPKYSSEAVLSLRNILKAFRDGKIFRKTPEFEALITI